MPKEIKIKKSLSQSFKEWSKGTSFGKMVNSLAGKAIFVFINVFVLLAVLHVFGFENLDPVALSGKLFTAIWKWIVG